MLVLLVLAKRAQARTVRVVHYLPLSLALPVNHQSFEALSD
jgi:hypothetical protein